MQNKKITRIISMLLIVTMASTGIPVTGYAAAIPEEQQDEVVQAEAMPETETSAPVEVMSESESDTQADDIPETQSEFASETQDDTQAEIPSETEDSTQTEIPSETEDGTQADVTPEIKDNVQETITPETGDGAQTENPSEADADIEDGFTSGAEDNAESEFTSEVEEDVAEFTSDAEIDTLAETSFEYKDIAWLQSKITSGITLSSDNSKIDTINIQNSSGLIFLSQLSPELYQTAKITLSQTGATAYFDITSNYPINGTGSDWKEGDSEKYIYHPMGSETYPFCGSINYGTYKIVGTTPLFDYLGGATITGNGDTPLTLARFTYLSSENVSPMLANHYVPTGTDDSEDSTPKECSYSIKLEKYNNLEFEPKFDGIIGDIADNVNLTLNVINEKESDVEGSENAGFICNTLGKSSLKINLSSTTIKNNVKAFNGNAGGLIGYVKAGAEVTVNGDYEYQGKVNPDSNRVTEQKNAGGLIGALEGNATVTVNGNATVSGSVNAITGNAGGLVGEVGSVSTATGETESFSDGENTSTSSITVTGTVSTGEGKLSVSSESAAAGGIVGNMESGSSLSIGDADNRTILNNNLTVSGSAAGALLGKGEDIKLSDAYVTIGEESLEQAPTVSGKNSTDFNNSIGGLVGTYKTTGAEGFFTAYNGATDSALQVKSVKLSSTEGGDKLYAGGLIGILDLCGDFSVSSAQIASSMAGVANYGGLAGQIISSLTDTTKLQQFIVSADANSSSIINTANNSKADLISYGGIAACADNVSVKLDGTVAVTATECVSMTTAGHYFGGAVAKLGDSSVLDISDDAIYSLNARGIIYGGGITGYTGQGSAVRLAGTTDLSNISFTDQYKTYYNQFYGTEAGNNFGGQIVGAQNSSLIYATKKWTLKRPAEEQPIDDIGNYGSVIRLGKNIGRGSEQLGNGTGLNEELITIDETTNKITLKKELKADISEATVNINNENQFALLAIAEQSKGYFSVYDDTQTKDIFILKDGMINVINFTQDINLQSTGITGLQRDCYLGEWAFPGNVAEANVNVNGNSHTITLAAGETFGSRNNIVISDNAVSGSGQIHGHAQVGLFSQANGSFKDITFAGTINLWEREGTTKEAGAATAVNTWETSYENVTTNVTINSLGSSGSYSHIGGLIGRKNNDALTIRNCVGHATINAGNSKNVAYGGILGYFTGKGTISVDTLKLTGRIEDESISDARVGGFVSVVDKNAELIMTLNNLTVEGQKIETDASATSGGLLGYDWNNTEVTFKGAENTADGAFGVKVADNSEVKVTGDASCGALVYCATGYWQVNSIKLEKVSVISGRGDLGLLICKAIYRDNDANLFLYLEETSHGAYQIGNEVSVTNTGGNFDEWVVYTADSADKIVGNECSVISIATAEGNRVADSRVGVDPADEQCTSYQNRTEYGKTAAANPNARYYYDLDVIRAKFDRTTDNQIDSAEELMLWSVYQYTLSNTWKDSGYPETNISTYFKKADAASATIDGGGKNIDLIGYSYYPVQVKTTTTVTNINFTFANKEIERAEAKTDASLDSLNRKTSGTSTEHTQHYLMQYGLFANVYGGVTLSASNVSFGGTVGYSEGTSGALVCGITQGESSTKILNIKLSSITLDGVKLYDGNDKFDTNGFAVTDKYSALLINQIGNYSTFEVERKNVEGAFGVKTTDKYSNTEHNTTYYAAGSLVGTVGSTNGTYIHMNFLGTMALDGRDTSNTVKTYDKRYGTCHSVFTRATLLESFQYPTSETSSGGFYNFNKGDVCTYGKEISNTDSGRNQKNQYQYYDDKSENGYVKDSTTGADAKNDADGKSGGFSTGYLRYVQVVENKSGNWELDINQKQVAFDDGCGTYGHPYKVNSADQLIAIMNILDTATFNPGFVIQVNNNVLNDSKGDSDYHNTTSTNDKLLYFDGTNWSIAQEDGDSYKAGTTTETVDKSKLLKYIRNAYYMITTDISLDVSSFRGLGSHELTESNNTGGAFSGVIVGQKKSDGNYPTITLHGTTLRDNFGGLVRYSQGSVIKDLNIKYEKIDTNTLTINKKDNTCALETQPFFGGVIGWAFGGDSIIDNVNVTYDKNYIQIENAVTPAGGYVGIVGGDTAYGGGVVFRNMSNGSCEFYVKDNLSSSDDYKSNYYWNPFVGRVYDGYVCYDSVNSSDANKKDDVVYLQNTDKNYTIPNLKSTEKLSVDKWSSSAEINNPATVNVGSAEQLWVLSAIVSSGAGGARNNGSYTTDCKAYSYGKVRSGKYDAIGTATEASVTWFADDEKKWGGCISGDKNDAEMSKIPYLIRNYTQFDSTTNKYPVVRITGEKTCFKLSITSNCDMSDYKNGFRGIGPVYPTSGKNYILSGNNQKIDSAMQRKIIRMSEISGTESSPVITMQRTLNLPQADGNWVCATLGLFTYLDVWSNLEIKNIKIGGKLEVNNAVAASDDYLIGGIASGIVFSDDKWRVSQNYEVTFNNVRAENLEIISSSSSKKLWGRHAGGFLGGIYFVKKCTFKNCGYSNLTIKNTRWTAGGIAGNVLVPVEFDGNGVTIQNGVFDQNMVDSDPYVKQGYVTANWYAVGGLFGYNEEEVSIKNIKAENINVSGWVTGGLIGASVKKTNISDVQLKRYSAVGLETIASASGGIIGLYSSKGNDELTLELTNLSVSDAEILLPKATNNYNSIRPSAGGIVGSSRMAASMKKRNLVIKNCHVSNSTIVSDGPAGGLIGDSGILLSKSGISNAVVSDSKIAASTYNSDQSGVGGFIGMTSSTIKGYNLYSKGNIVGYLLNNNQLWSGNVDDLKKQENDAESIINVTFRGLDPAKITKDNVGLILSTSNSPSYCSYATYLLPNNTTSVAENSRAGIWIGNTGADDQEIQLIAVRRSGDCTAVHNFGRAANSANTRVIYNDYTGVSTAKMEKAAEKASTDTTWPYVAENPEHTFSTNNGNYEQYGDGMGFTSKSENDATQIPIAEQIAKETEQVAANPTGYSNTGYKYFYDACQDDFADNKWKYETSFASFLQSEEIQSNITDFPVLVVEDSSTINNQIKETLKLLTNSGYVDTAVADVNKVECNVLSLNDDGKFTVGNSKVRAVDQAASNASIWYDTDNKVFRARNAVAFDSGKRQFTLVTVTLGSDPNAPEGTTKEFKVSLAVYVQKNIYFKFYASGISGTTYEPQSYLSNNSAVMTNYGDSFTEMLSFEFERTNDEWLQALNAGENLCVSYDKSIWLGKLPEGTKFVLVDPQQSGNTAYYASLSKTTDEDGTSNAKQELSFSDFKDSKGGTWQDVTISDYLKAKAIEVDSSSEGTKFVQVQENGGATVKCDGKYYRLATSEELAEENTKKYTISFENKAAVQYHYYLTVVIPENESGEMINNLITYDDTWLTCTTEGGIRAKNNNDSVGAQKIFARTSKGNENRYIIYNFFNQTISAISSNPGSIILDEASKTATLTHTITNTINLDKDKASTFRDYATDNTKLFQRFDMSLKDVDNSTETSTVIAAGTRYEIAYVIEATDTNGNTTQTQIPGYTGTISTDCTTYSFPYASQDVLDSIIGYFKNSGYDSITMKATLNLIYDEETLYKQFKVKEDSSDKNDFGLRYSFTSKLSMNESTIAATSVKKQASVGTLFYRSSYELAKLSYNAIDGVATTERSGDVSKLGINAFSSKEYQELLSNPSEISSMAGYDVTAMKNRTDGAKIHCVFKLYCKMDNGEYQQVTGEISDYLTAPKIRNVTASEGASSNAYVLDFDMTEDEKKTYATVPITFTVDYAVNTEANLPSGAAYSNYKVVLTVDMLKADGTSLDMVAEDYIIYTNAKINPAIQPRN